MIISSVDNTIVKRTASLKEAKYRKIYGQFMLEGKRIVRDYLDDGGLRARFPLERIFLREGTDFDFPDAVTVTEKVFSKLCDTVSSQGVLAVLGIPESAPRGEGNFLVLDGIGDPGNLGAIIRTAAAAGFGTVYLAGNCADAYSPKAVRASMGGILYVNLIRSDATEISAISGVNLLSADMAGKSIYEYRRKDNDVGLIIGGEATGVSRAFRTVSESIGIPMKNIESLNAAVAASILMYFLKKH